MIKRILRWFNTPLVYAENRRLRRTLELIRDLSYPNGVIYPGEALDAICDEAEKAVGRDDRYEGPKAATVHRHKDWGIGGPPT